MAQGTEQLWRLVASQYERSVDPRLAHEVSAALASEAVQLQCALLERLRLRIDPSPALWARLPGPYLRLFFRVDGEDAMVEEGHIVALVLLHDLRSGQTLYAHPVHAGPQANPLLKHLYGPMATPKAQEGTNGDRATLRLLEHKRAIWDQFLLERESVGPIEAGRRWRERYFWSLVRLYFCERCPGCRWGSPSFDGVPGEAYRPPRGEPRSGWIDSRLTPEYFDRLTRSVAWKVESSYARRGGFEIRPTPMVATKLPEEAVFAAFPTDVEFVEPGVLVGVALYADASSGEVRYAHVLSAGPEAEPALLFGDRALGLPRPQAGDLGDAARDSYARWRQAGWSQFWLRELEEGLHSASGFWLAEFWAALARLFGFPVAGGNGLPRTDREGNSVYTDAR